ncbi:MAG: hypothetical protein ACRC62_35125 [Microcoleus sp.]
MKKEEGKRKKEEREMGRWGEFSNSQFPIPNSQFPIPEQLFTIPKFPHLP